MTSTRLSVTREGDASVLALKGDFDFALSGELEQMLERMIEEGRNNIVVDMKNIGFVGSTVVGVLLGCAGRFRRRGGEIKICEITPQAKEVFDILGVQKFVAVFPTREEAVNASAAEARRRLGIPERREGAERRSAETPFEGSDRRRRDRRLK